jgi:NADPH:quinone reductase-like Zn-dependent oxidoreductase
MRKLVRPEKGPRNFVSVRGPPHRSPPQVLGGYCARMKAAVHTRYGLPDVVRVVDVPTPTAKDNKVLVKVYATTVNRTDCGFRGAKPFFIRVFTGPMRPRVSVLGNEFAGQVEALGPAVTSFAVGDRVFGYDDTAFGAHAQYLTIREDASVAKIPANLTYAQAASATEGSHYALANIKKAKIRAGQRVLVNGATGAIGSAAVQLLASRGVHVTAVCDTAHLELVRGLGAERVIDRTAEDFTQDEQTYNAVFDAVGKSSFGRCRRLLEPHGVYLSTDLGPGGQNPFLALVTPLLPGKSVLFALPRHDQAMMNDFKDLLESGLFRPVIDRTYPLAEIVEAYRYVETGQKIGNVVITIEQGD